MTIGEKVFEIVLNLFYMMEKKIHNNNTGDTEMYPTMVLNNKTKTIQIFT